jgi:TPR repeat protein
MDSDWVDEDVELELPMAPDFLSSRAMVPGGYSAPGSPTPRLSSRKILVPSVNPIAFAVKKTPSTPTGPRPPITDLVKSSAPELAVKMRADKGDRDAQVMWAQHLKKNKQFEEAAVYWKMAADAGADRGQYYYGDALKRGLGVPVDLAEAARYFKSAADSGMKEAMFEYGILRRKVDEVEGDKYIQSAYNRRYKLALRWYGVQERRKGNDSRAFNCFRLAAEQGDAESQFFVGELLRDGRGTPKNPQEAERYFRQAVAKGHSGAAFALALLTRVSRPDESKMLLEKAARCKHGGAIFYLGRQKLAEGFEEEGNALIFEAAVRGHPDAMAMYAIAELDRQNDSPEILQFLESAAKHGSPDATIRLAERMMGENEQQAMDLIKHVASRDHPRAHYLYGIALLRRGAETDGKTHLRKAIELGDIDAIWALAAASFFIDPEEQHFFSIVKEHREALRQAADQGNGYAIYWLSKLTDDKDIGITLLKDAAERGVPQAQCDYAVLIQETNHAEADALFRSALEKHSAVAQLWFARINLTQGNKQKGISFLRRACQQGNIEAQFEFGKRIFGPTSRPEFEEALSFLRKAACTGHLPAMFFLGKYLLSIHDDSGHSYMREALARGYSETAPDADGSPT